ncbi:MAG: tandem-95 repeat protein [Spirochaetaceae bacterium]|nr:tandem-95 repeat protein [Spirochaetaceae bacterium]
MKFTPVGNWNGQAAFTFKVADQSDAESAAATATVTVSAAADPPVASALGVSTTEDTVLTFTATDFEGAFSDPDSGDSLKAVRVVTLPAATAGALALGADAVTANDLIAHGSLGTLKFTPVGNWNGQAAFTFKVADQSDAESAAATATIAVTAANDAPAAAALAAATTEDTVLTFTAAQFDAVFSDDLDSGDSLKAVRVVTLPAATAGALALGGNAVTANQVIARGALGTLKFTPVGNWNGQAAFTFKVADQSDAESAAATATVTVSAAADPPVASALGVSTTEDTVLTFTATDFEGAFSDPDSGDSLKAVRVVTLPAATAGALTLGAGTVKANDLVAHASLGTLKFTPVGNWNGQATFTFKVADQSDAESAAATATVTVNAANDAPAAGALALSTTEDTALTFTAAQFDGVFGDVDENDRLKSVKVVSLPAGTTGALALGGSAVAANQVIARGALGTLTFTPAANWYGQATFTFQVVDQSDAASAAATATVTVRAAADAPAASALHVSTAEDTALAFTAAHFDGVFSDPDSGDSLKAVRVVTLPAGTAGALALGTTAVKANDLFARGALGTLTFTPVANWNGKATFTFKVADQAGAESATATATITVRAANDPPAATALALSTTEDVVLTFTAAHFDRVFSDDRDTGDSLKAVRVVTLPASTAGALALGGSAVTANRVIARGALGTLTFTPAANWNGEASFTFKVADQAGAESAAATATVTVTAAADAPVARALNVSTAEETALTFTAAHFEGTFSDPDAGDSLKAVRVVALPAATAGALALSGTAVTANQAIAHAALGTLKFTPVADYAGKATFTFKVVDQSDAESAAATATVTVQAANDAPAAGALNVSTAEDTALSFTAAQFEAAFSDPDAGDSLKSVKVVSLPAAAAGALALNGTAVTANQKVAHGSLGKLTFTPAADWHGEATFTFKVVDQADVESGAAATATVTVTAAADAPAASALNVSTAEDAAFSFTAAQFEGSFSDPDTGDSLKSVKVVSLPAAAAGVLALSGTAVTANQKVAHADLGSLVFTPAANWHGKATFTFKVVDQSGTESAAAATATVTVTAVNDAPAAAALGLSTAEDTALSFTAAHFEGVFSDSDASDSLKEVKVVTLPAAAAGVLALNGTAVTANRTIAHGSLGTLTFIPAANWNGKATFTFKVVDQSDAESGATATATVTVTAVADAPAAGALNVSTAEDTALSFTAAHFEGAFSDPDADDSLKQVKVVTLPAATAGALALDGTAVTANQKITHGSLGTLTFTPVANWNGKATFTFTVADQAGTESAAAATATITVGGAHDAPTAGALNVSTAEDTAFSFTAAQFDGVFSDADTGDRLKQVKVVTLPAAAAGALALNGTAVTANQAIAHADLGKLTFTPAANYAGQATFGFQVSDQTDLLSATATATVTVTAVADAPAAAALNVSTGEDTAFSFTAAQFDGVFSDADAGDSLKEVQVVSLPDAGHGALALNGTAVTANGKIAHGSLGTLTFTPVADWNGEASFTFRVVDQTDRVSATATATVTVTAVADAPAAGALGVSTAEDTALSFTAADFTDVFSDPDAGDSLKEVRVVSLPDAEHGALTVMLDGVTVTAVTANQAIARGDLGTLTFTPVADWNGEASFTFRVVDQTDRLSAAATATVTVTAVADAPKGAAPREVVPGDPSEPAASLLTVSTAEDTALSFTAAQFEGVFSDPDDGDSLKAVQVVSLPDAGHGVLALQGALDPSATAVTANQEIAHGDLGGLTFTPAANWHGAATFTFKLVDQSNAASDAATATVTVTAVNDAPAASALNLSTSEDTALSFTAAQFEAAFSDVDDGDSLKAVQVATLPAATAGALALNGTAVTANQEIAHGDLGSLTFTPAAAYLGNATFTFKVVDQSAVASAAAATATIAVTDHNEGPIAPGAIPDQTATQGVPFTYTAPATVFSDPDGDTLVWTAAARGPGADEPAGEGPGDVGVDRGVRMRRASDSGNPRNTGITRNIGDTGDTGDTGGDNDPGNTGGPADWLSFDGATRTFDGTPATPDVDGTTIRVIATDPSGAFAYAEFTLRVLPPVQVSVSGPAAPVAEGASATFTVALSRAAPADVTVRWATADGTGDDAATAGSDYTAQAPTDVTIAAGQTERTVAVATLADGEDEDAETFTVQLSLTADGLPAGVELGTDSATASIVDTAPPPSLPARSPSGAPAGGPPARDDRARVSLVSPAPVREGETAVIEVVLSRPVAQAFTVHWSTADGTASAAGGDYEPHAAVPVTFAAGDTRRSAQVATHADYLEEGAETFLLRLGAPRPLPAGVAFGTSQVTVRIDDNRRPVADAGPDQEVDPGAAVTLDGSASHDPDDEPITGYAWTQTAGIAVVLDDAGSATPTFTAPELPGPLTFELVVAAGGLDSLPDEVTVTVRDVAPRFLDSVDDLTFVAESAIEPLTLPAASGGNGPLSYELTSEPAGWPG